MPSFRHAILLMLCACLGAEDVVPTPPVIQPEPSTTPKPLPDPSPVAPTPVTEAEDPNRSTGEGPVAHLDAARPVNTVDPVNGMGIDGTRWVYAVRGGASAGGLIYIGFASEETMAQFEGADSDARRKYIDIARGSRPGIDPRAQGEPAKVDPVK